MNDLDYLQGHVRCRAPRAHSISWPRTPTAGRSRPMPPPSPDSGQLAPRRAAPRHHGAEWRCRQARDDHRRRVERPSRGGPRRCGPRSGWQTAWPRMRWPCATGPGWTRCASGRSAIPAPPRTYQDYYTFVDGDFRPKPIYEALQRYAAGETVARGVTPDPHARVRAEPARLPQESAARARAARAGRPCDRGFALLRDRPDTLRDIQRAGAWRVGMDPSFPPFEFVDASGQAAGLDVDLAQALGQRLGIRTEIVTLGFDELIDAVAAHRVDAAISALPIQPERTQEVHFSEPYVQAGVVLAARAGAGPAAVDDLAGKPGGGRVGQPGRCRGAASGGAEPDAAPPCAVRHRHGRAGRARHRRGRRGDRRRDQPGDPPAQRQLTARRRTARLRPVCRGGARRRARPAQCGECRFARAGERWYAGRVAGALAGALARSGP